MGSRRNFENLNILRETESVIKRKKEKQLLTQKVLLVTPLNIKKKNKTVTMSILHKFFQKIEKERILANAHYEASSILI